MTHDVTVANPGRFMPMSEIITTAQDEWHAAMQLRGEFDASNCDDLHKALEEHLDAGRRVVRVDIREVAFIDSSAVGVLLRAHARCHAEHGSLIITGVQQRVARLFQITGLDHVLLIDTADDAPAVVPQQPVRRHPL